MSIPTDNGHVILLNAEAVPAVSRLSFPGSLALKKVLHSLDAFLGWAESPFANARGRRVADAWLQRSKKMRRFMRITNHDAVQPIVMLIPYIAPTAFVFGVARAFSNLNLEYGTWKYIIGFMPFASVAIFGTIMMASIISKYAHTLHKQSECPLHRDFYPKGLVPLREFPGETALRVVYAGDPERLRVLDDVVHAFAQELPTGAFRMLTCSQNHAEHVMERVRAELGEEDARGLMLLLAFPDEADALRGGEADELLSRVAEVINDTSSPSLALP